MKRNLAEARVPETCSGADINPVHLLEAIVQACEEAKGQDLVVLDVSKTVGIVDNFVIVSGRSDRQVQGIANRVLDALDKNDLTPLAVEGLEDGQWVLIDVGDMVIHVFYEPLRGHYDLESLWREKPEVKPVARKVAQGKTNPVARA